MNFLTFGFLDTFDLAASLKPRLHLFPPANEEGQRILNIRWPNAEGGWTVRKDASRTHWVELHNTLSRIQRLGNQFERGRIWMEVLEPGARLNWQHEESNGYSRLHLPLRTNPAAIVIAGIEARHLLPGTLTVIPTSGWCAVNLGEWARVHLCVEFKQKEQQP